MMAGVSAEGHHQALAAIVGAEHVLSRLRGSTSPTAPPGGVSRVGGRRRPPGSAEEVAAVVAWCYENELAIVPRGGGTGYAGGAVPSRAASWSATERMTRVRAFDPLLWRIEVEAGVHRRGARLARESGLLFPPDPGAAEQSQIGGNIATNAGGPHAFKYGVTGPG